MAKEIEVIDLTDPGRNSPLSGLPSSQTNGTTIAVQGSQPIPTLTIVISDDERDDGPPTKRRKRQKKKKKLVGEEEREVRTPQTATPRAPRADREQEERERYGRSSRRKRSREHSREYRFRDSEHSRRSSSSRPTGELFTLDCGPPVDAGPANDPILSYPSTPRDATIREGSISEHDGLFLPSHVSIFASSSGRPSAPLPPPSPTTSVDNDDDDDSSFIQYMEDDDNQRGITRYFQEHRNERRTTYACKHCGAEGDHKTFDCPVVICLTCGAHNEHLTRSCPISKTCFTCGLKGHINKNCPNRHSRHQISNADRLYDCDRCGSDFHTAKECPTLWRIYEYVSDEQRAALLDARKTKERLELGKGGEGFIANDLWCYNCGNDGHLGDRCNGASRPPEYPREPCAFSLYNLMAGPFADDISDRPSRPRKQREWEREGNFDDGYGFAGPSNVGKRGRDKEKERMRIRASETHVQEDEEDDWFGKRDRRAKLQSHPPPLGPKRQRSGDVKWEYSQSTKGKSSAPISFNFDRKNSSFKGKKPGLADRISDHKLGIDRDREATISHASHQDTRPSNSGRRRSSKGKKERERPRNEDTSSGKRGESDHADKSSSGPGRKYFGGYGR